MEKDNPFKDTNKEEVDANEVESTVAEELNTLTITQEKYKNIVINGVSVPSIVRVDSDEEPYIVKESRNVKDLTKDEIDWLNTNINFIVDANGDFINVSSGNQYVFYETLLRIQYFIYAHNIPVEFFDGTNNKSRYYKVWNIGYLIDNENYDSAYTPEFNICVDFNMNSEVESRSHAVKLFNRYTYDYLKDTVNIISYKVPKGSPVANARCSGRIVFKSIDAFEVWLQTQVITKTESPADNFIFNLFPKLNPIYLNSIAKTTDTFSFYANPKALIAQTDIGNTYKGKMNIVIFPEFRGKLNLTTYHAAAKTIEVEMERLSELIKVICNKFIYKKV